MSGRSRGVVGSTHAPRPAPRARRGPDAAYDAFTEWVAGQGLELYPHQDEAVLELLGGSHVVLSTPTGSGKSLVAVAAHLAALAEDRVSFYTAPIKALVNEKFFALCEIFGADDVGLLTGDASVNPDAPIICCTAEVLANIALREGDRADVGLVVMDEFHFYAEPGRGWAWQVPLLELRHAQFLLMSATLGDVSTIAEDLSRRTGRDTAVVADAVRPVPLSFTWSTEPLTDTLEELVDDRPGAGLRRPLHPGRGRRARHDAAAHRRPRQARRQGGDHGPHDRACGSAPGSARPCTSCCAPASASTTPGCCRSTAASSSSSPRRGC